MQIDTISFNALIFLSLSLFTEQAYEAILQATHAQAHLPQGASQRECLGL